MAKVKKREEYGDDSIEMLKGADRVRKNRRLFSARTVSRAASTRCLK